MDWGFILMKSGLTDSHSIDINSSIIWTMGSKSLHLYIYPAEIISLSPFLSSYWPFSFCPGTPHSNVRFILKNVTKLVRPEHTQKPNSLILPFLNTFSQVTERDFLYKTHWSKTYGAGRGGLMRKRKELRCLFHTLFSSQNFGISTDLELS